ncbi:hypothetical protein IscW_ISCW002546 [Ixodes scapularis]|uniref:Uncharacterized protein n=1 Tax=Ixodes scapularis TaxID=6945 RepID=B7PCB0_IXOSC|nr:hypothetical protein IscW_ISCW002546 [Ixodes scapularis]|eukprot:XP_002409565.1 hypothetical protein IscW_ISCW002546 [Ixodes scapularis]
MTSPRSNVKMTSRQCLDEVTLANRQNEVVWGLDGAGSSACDVSRSLAESLEAVPGNERVVLLQHLGDVAADGVGPVALVCAYGLVVQVHQLREVRDHIQPERGRKREGTLTGRTFFQACSKLRT